MNFPRTLFLLTLPFVLAACQPAADPTERSAPESVAPASTPADAAPPSGETAATEPPARPSLVVETLDHGVFDLAERRGGWVVVNFWATWCKPCLKEIPDFSAFDAARDDVEVIGLAYEEIEVAAMREFLAKHPAGYPIALLDVYDPPADFETPRGLPMTYLIAPDGRVARKFLGPVTSQELAAAIAEAGGPGPAGG